MAEARSISEPPEVGRLEWLARSLAEGTISGLHRSPFKGSSVEFAEHRQYGPGDEIRHIDWRAFGKTDRYFVKEYEEETNLDAHLVVDWSSSMAYVGTGGVPSKIDRARGLAAAIAYLLIGQRDAVGLVAPGRLSLPPKTAPGHFAALCRAMEAIVPSGEARPSASLRGLAGRSRRRGLVLVFSDGFDRLDDLLRSLRLLRHRRQEVAFFQVLAPDEETFPFAGTARFRDLERPAREVRARPEAVRDAYLGRFEAHAEGLRDGLLAIDATYQRVSTADPLGKILLDALAARRPGRPRR